MPLNYFRTRFYWQRITISVSICTKIKIPVVVLSSKSTKVGRGPDLETGQRLLAWGRSSWISIRVEFTSICWAMREWMWEGGGGSERSNLFIRIPLDRTSKLSSIRRQTSAWSSEVWRAGRWVESGQGSDDRQTDRRHRPWYHWPILIWTPKRMLQPLGFHFLNLRVYKKLVFLLEN